MPLPSGLAITRLLLRYYFVKRVASSVELVTRDSFEYSDQDKLVKHKHRVNNLPEELLTLNTYDELGQLISKKVGGTDITGTNAHQKVDYSYNIRGWLKGINNVSDLAPSATENDFFAFKLNYNTLENGLPSNLNNGNIAETLWRTDSDNIKRKYDYKYDQLNRLLEANYSKPGSNSTPNNYMEKLDYDKNGNIKNLERNGDLDNDGIAAQNQIDKLIYTYHADKKNELLHVFDESRKPQGFKDEPNVPANATADATADYVYDKNGNMITDNNKGITTITYNHLNLPVKITFGTLGTIEYIYNATGQKLTKKVTENSVVTTTDYLTGFQYKNNGLTLFPTAEGYVNFVASKYGTYKYVYNFTDHLGNVRLSYSLDNNVLKILEETFRFIEHQK